MLPMGVYRFVVGLLYRSLLFLIRLPRPVFSFVRRIFGVMENNWWSVNLEQGMGNWGSTDEEYDSTWESDHEETSESLIERSFGARRNTYAARDMQTYRHKYQKTLNDDEMNVDEYLPNVQFYRDEMPFNPDGVHIEVFLKNWFGDYDQLEYVHSYIQWLFPIQEKGMNFQSHELSLTEIKLFRTDEELKKRLLRSYKLMLDFYGIELVSEETGEVKRAKNWEPRFKNLNRNTHNNLRITRILKCLGLLGFGHYQAPLVRFFLEETLVNNILPRVKESALDYFMFTVLDKSKRKELIKFAFQNFKPKPKFVWCPRRIFNKFSQEESTESNNTTTSPNKGMSSDSDRNRLMYIDTSNEKSLDTDSGNDGNVSGEHQDLAVHTVGNANISDADKEIDSQKDTDSNDEAAIQKDEGKNKKIANSVEKATDENYSEFTDPTKQSKHLSGDNDSSTASTESTNEKPTQTSNHSSVTSETPPSGIDNEQQDNEIQTRPSDELDKSEQGNKEELKSQHASRDLEDIQKSGNESSEDSVATGITTIMDLNSTHHDAEKSADKNSGKYTSNNETSFAQTSVSSKEVQPPESDRDIKNGQKETNQGDELLKESTLVANVNTSPPKKDTQSKCDLIPPCAAAVTENIQQPPTTPESDETTENSHQRHEPKKQDDEMFDQPKANAVANTKEQANDQKEDPIHQSMEDNAEDRRTEQHVSNVVTLPNNDNPVSRDPNSREYSEYEQGTALRSDGNSSQVTPGKDTETGESSKEKSGEDKETEIRSVRVRESEEGKIMQTQF